jgi:hypothetical protein
MWWGNYIKTDGFIVGFYVELRRLISLYFEDGA